MPTFAEQLIIDGSTMNDMTDCKRLLRDLIAVHNKLVYHVFNSPHDVVSEPVKTNERSFIGQVKATASCGCPIAQISDHEVEIQHVITCKNFGQDSGTATGHIRGGKSNVALDDPANHFHARTHPYPNSYDPASQYRDIVEGPKDPRVCSVCHLLLLSDQVLWRSENGVLLHNKCRPTTVFASMPPESKVSRFDTAMIYDRTQYCRCVVPSISADRDAPDNRCVECNKPIMQVLDNE